MAEEKDKASDPCCPKCGSKRKIAKWLPVSQTTAYTCVDCGHSYQKTE